MVDRVERLAQIRAKYNVAAIDVTFPDGGRATLQGPLVPEAAENAGVTVEESDPRKLDEMLFGAVGGMGR